MRRSWSLSGNSRGRIVCTYWLILFLGWGVMLAVQLFFRVAMFAAREWLHLGSAFRVTCM
jgi:hypothetical protein